MRKTRKEPPAPDHSRWVFIAGAVVVVALLGFSFARTMRLAPASAPSPAAAVPSPAEPASTPAADPQTEPAGNTTSLPPMASTRPGAALPPPDTRPPAFEPEPTAAEVAHVARTTADELHSMFETKQVTIIDVRDKDSYLYGHIPGSLHIPLAYIAGEVPYLPKGKPIVTYCT